MRRLRIAACIGLALMTAACGETTHPENARAASKEIVAAPPASVYADLDAAFTGVETAAKSAKPLTHDTREPIVFKFEREPGKRLRLEAKARFRTVIVHAFIDPGPTPNDTRLRAYFEKKAVQEKGDSDYLSVALTNLLGKDPERFGDYGRR